jgi:hypothetical protein
MSDLHETTGPDGHDRMEQLMGSIVDAAGAAARMPGPAVPWRHGRRRRRVRLAAQGAGALALLGGIVAAPALVTLRGGDENLGTVPTPGVSPTPLPFGEVPVPGLPAAVVRTLTDTWEVRTGTDGGKLCVELRHDGETYNGQRSQDTTDHTCGPYTTPAGRAGGPFPVFVRAMDTCMDNVHRSATPVDGRGSYKTVYHGFADTKVARIRLSLSDGRTVDLPGPQLQLIRGTSVKFWAFNPRACVDLVRLSAYGADGRLLAERGEEWFFTTNPRAVDLSTTVPYRSTHARPSDRARVVDLRFSASLPARERTAILVALEERGAHIILKGGDHRYGLEHIIPEHWDAVRARLDAERAAGRLTYTVRTVVAGLQPVPTQTPGANG